MNITDDEFLQIRELVYQLSGINLSKMKQQLVIARLSKRLKALNLSSFSEYIELLKFYDPEHLESRELINRISTNQTNFFRENHHFSFFAKEILPFVGTKKLKIWSAACSSGEEPYSIAISLFEYQRTTKHYFSWEILASDISTNILEKAVNGIYRYEDISSLETSLQKRYFLKGKNDKKGMVRVKSQVRSKVNFKQINLMDQTFPFASNIDLIFMRNVIIYFDQATKQKLILRIQDYLKEGGYLFLGHSESLFNMNSKLKLAGKTIYRKLTQ